MPGWKIEINECDDIKKINESTRYIYWNLREYPLSLIFPNLPKSVDTLVIGSDFSSEKMIIPDQITGLKFETDKVESYCEQENQIIVPTFCYVVGCEKKYILRGNYNDMSNDKKLSFLIKNNANDFYEEIIELFNQKLKPNQENLYHSIKNKNDKFLDLCIEFGCKVDDEALKLACSKKHVKAIIICLKNGLQITENEIELMFPKNK